jgi:HK97 family phage major capsid protein
MKLNSKELREKAERTVREMQAILDKKGPLTLEEEQRFDELSDEHDVYSIGRRRVEKARELEEELRGVDINDPIAKLSPIQRRKVEQLSLAAYLKDGGLAKELHSIMSPVRMAEQGTSGSSGGYTIPLGFQNELEKAVREFGGMWGSSRIIKTKRGSATPFPMIDDTNNKAYLIDESDDHTTDAQSLVFGALEFQGFAYTSGMIQAPIELLEDSELFASEIISVLAERIYRGTNAVFTTGDGSGKPKGILPAASLGCHSANDSTLAYTDFKNLLHSVDPGYRKSSAAGWMFHDSVLKEARNIKDLSDRPMFDKIDEGLILGYPYTINQDLPEFIPGSSSANDNDKPVLFGDLSKYTIRTVKNMRIVRLSQRFADLDQVAFVVIFRVDGDLLDAGRNPVKYLRISAT